MDYKRIIIFLPALLLFNGCGIYTNYHRPESLPVDSLYRDVPEAMQDTSSLADLSWRELFTDSLLVKWIEVGLEKNSDIQTARLLTEEAQASLQASRLAFLPSVSLAPQGSLSSFDGAKPSKTYSLGGTAEWEIDAFGGLRNAKKGSRAALEASRAYEQAVQTQLIATIANSYYMLLMLDEQLKISRRTAENWAENLRVMKALKNAGQATEMAVAQTEASKLSMDASLLSLKKQIAEQENSLSALLGMSPTKIERSTLGVQFFPDILLVGIPLQLLQRRPDVRKMEWKLAEAFYATNEARSAFYPQITLSGSAGWTNSMGTSIVNPGDWLISAVSSLVQPFFNKGRNVVNLKIAKMQQQEALLAFRQSLLDAGMEVNNALVQWQSARGQRLLGEQQITSLASAVRSTELLMKHSSQNYLEVLTARQTLLQAELDVASARFNEIQGVVSLYHALGGGVD